jgi:hypothetical protein
MLLLSAEPVPMANGLYEALIMHFSCLLSSLGERVTNPVE